MSRVYEVYVCKYNGEIVYIGKGVKGRHKHCKSGTSHVFDLNRLYFTGLSDLLTVEIVGYFEKDEEALRLEKSLILKHQPKFNDVFVANSRNNTSRDSLRVRGKLKNRRLNHKSLKSAELYQKLVDEFFDFYNYRDVLSSNLTILSRSRYGELGFKSLENLSRFLLKSERYSERHYCRLFVEGLRDELGVDLFEIKLKTK